MAASEQVTYDNLLRLVMPQRLFETYGYARQDPSNPGLCLPPRGEQFHSDFLNRSFECRRCKKDYRVDASGVPIGNDPCYYHSGRIRYGSYDCCTITLRGCQRNWCHTHQSKLMLESNRGFVRTRAKPELGPDNKHGIFALDCEMCSTIYGYEPTRVTVINYDEQVVYNKLVKPTHRVLDYNTIFSGISEADLEGVTLTLSDVQAELLELFSDKTILIGHGLDADLRTLKLFHERVIDTVQVYPHARPLPYRMSLKRLAEDYLRERIQTGGGGHDSEVDARTALRLALRKTR